MVPRVSLPWVSVVVVGVLGFFLLLLLLLFCLTLLLGKSFLQKLFKTGGILGMEQ